MVSTVDELARAMPDVSCLESCQPPMESPEHYDQLALLMACLKGVFAEQDDIFLGANLTVYFSEEQVKNRDFRGPDLFVVKDVEPRERPSWVVWHEGGRYPDFILELLSKTTSDNDRGIKKQLYQTQFRTPEYVWFSPQTLEFAGFRLMAGKYEPIAPNPHGWLWSETLGLYLGVWEGQLRFFFKDGTLVLTPEEMVARERERADREQERRREAEAALESLLKSLRDRGIDPASLGDN